MPQIDRIRFLCIGDVHCGKSCISNRFVNNRFDAETCSTIGVDFLSRKIHLNSIKKNVVVDIYDTAGSEKFRSITSSFYRSVDAILIVYDCTNTQSFEHIRYWKQNVEQYADKNVVIALIGNKVDEPTYKHKISYEQALALACSLEIHHVYQISAKNNLHIEELFQQVSSECYHVKLLKQEEEQMHLKNQNQTQNVELLSNENNDNRHRLLSSQSCCK